MCRWVVRSIRLRSFRHVRSGAGSLPRALSWFFSIVRILMKPLIVVLSCLSFLHVGLGCTEGAGFCSKPKRASSAALDGDPSNLVGFGAHALNPGVVRHLQRLDDATRDSGFPERILQPRSTMSHPAAMRGGAETSTPTTILGVFMITTRLLWTNRHGV